jgi:DNA-binding transcriptional LysR family regulator
MLTIYPADLRALQVLLTVEHEGGFAPAARRLGVTRAAVSRSIAELERRLGTRLARRTTRKVVLTESALALLERCRGPVTSIREAFEVARERDDELAGLVRIAGPTAFGRDVLVPLLLEFQRTHLAISLDLRMSDGVEDLVAEPIDLTVRLGPLPDVSLVARSVGTLPLVLVAAPSVLREHGHPKVPDDLRRMPAVAFRVPRSKERYPWAFSWRQPALASPSVRAPRGPGALGTRGGSDEHVLLTPDHAALESDSIDAVAALVRAGAGVGLVPRHLVAGDLERAELVALLPDLVGRGPVVSLCHAGRRLMPRRVRSLMDHLVSTLPVALAPPLTKDLDRSSGRKKRSAS